MKDSNTKTLHPLIEVAFDLWETEILSIEGFFDKNGQPIEKVGARVFINGELDREMFLLHRKIKPALLNDTSESRFFGSPFSLLQSLIGPLEGPYGDHRLEFYGHFLCEDGEQLQINVIKRPHGEMNFPGHTSDDVMEFIGLNHQDRFPWPLNRLKSHWAAWYDAQAGGAV